MKKLIIIAGFVAASSITAFAQNISFGVKAGLNVSKLTEAGGISSQTLPGFQVGGVVDLGFQDFSIQPGIFFTTKGGKFNETEDVVTPGGGGGAVTDNGNITLNYIEVPVNFLYNVAAGGNKFYLGAGPYLGYGLSGSGTLTEGVATTRTNVTFGSGQDDVKNPDLGVNFLIGFKFSQGYSIGAQYGLGLSNLSNEGDGSKIKNQVISFTVGYFF
jgi:hypothetical protein